MVIAQGDIRWADLGDPVGSTPGYRRPVLVVQSDSFNRSRIGTILCVPLTGNITRANLPGNVLLSASQTGLDRDSVANTSLTLAIDRSQLCEQTGQVPRRLLERVFNAIDMVLGR